MILASLVIWAIRIKPLAIRNRLNVKSGANLGWYVWADYTEVSEYLRANCKKDQMIRLFSIFQILGFFLLVFGLASVVSAG